MLSPPPPPSSSSPPPSHPDLSPFCLSLKTGFLGIRRKNKIKRNQQVRTGQYKHTEGKESKRRHKQMQTLTPPGSVLSPCSPHPLLVTTDVLSEHQLLLTLPRSLQVGLPSDQSSSFPSSPFTGPLPVLSFMWLPLHCVGKTRSFRYTPESPISMC